MLGLPGYDFPEPDNKTGNTDYHQNASDVLNDSVRRGSYNHPSCDNTDQSGDTEISFGHFLRWVLIHKKIATR